MFLLGLLMIYTLIIKDWNFLHITKIILRENVLVFILLTYLIIIFLNSDKFYLSVFKDIMNIIILIIIYGLYYIYITNKSDLSYSLSVLIRLIIFLSFIISLFGILDMFDIYSINKLNSDGIEDSYIDTNFSLLPVFFGIVSIFYLLKKNYSVIIKIQYNFLLVFFSFYILLSGSRRGIILFVIIYIIANLITIVKQFKVGSRIQNFNFSCFPITLPILLLLMYLFFFQFSYLSKNSIFNSIGTKNKELVRIRLAAGISRIAKVFYEEIDYQKVYNNIWKNVFDPKNPDSGWGKRIHRSIYPLYGENVEIVPKGSIGYLLDNTCDASYYSNVDVSEAYSSVFDIKVVKGESYRVSVYCYVSEDFDGTSAYLMLGDSEAFNRGFRRSNYQLSKKGIWQKLELEFLSSDGIIPVYIAFMKSGVQDFSKLKGHVVFAYPEFERIEGVDFNKFLNAAIDPKNPESGWGSRRHKSIFPLTGKNVEMLPSDCIGYLMDSTCNASYYPEVNACEAFSLLYNLDVKSGDQYNISVYCFVSNEFDGSSAYLMLGDSKAFKEGIRIDNYDLSNRNVWQKLELKFSCADGLIPVYLSFLKREVTNFSNMKGYVIFAYPQIEKTDTNFNFNYSFTKEQFKPTNCIKYNKDSLYYSNIENELKLALVKSRKSNFKWLNMVPVDLSYSCIFTYSNDPINNWIKKLFPNDTSYCNLKNITISDTKTLRFGDDRYERWKFALKIFKYEYNIFEKIFGGGFSFLNWYGAVFQKSKIKEDYPHNPFLYILLYSGILGLLFYIFLLVRIVKCYIRYFKKYYIFNIFFLFIYYFAFFSGGNPFDPPILGFFILFPIFINYINMSLSMDKIHAE